MGATQNDGVDGRILGHEFVNALLDEIIGTGAVGFVVLYKGHPERAGHAADTDVGKKFGYLDVVTMTAHGTLGSQQSHVTATGERADNFGRGADDAQHAARSVPTGQVVLLNGAQGLGRRGVAAQNDQLTAHAEEFQNGLTRKLVYDVERAGAIRGTGIVAQIHVVVLGQQLADAMKDGQTAVARVENADGAGITG